MMETLGNVRYLLGYYRRWENLYVDNSDADFQENIVDLYKSILVLQERVLKYLRRNDLLNLGRNTLKRDDWSGLNDAIDKCHDKCEQRANIEDRTRLHAEHMRRLDESVTQTELQRHMLESLRDLRLAAWHKVARERGEEVDSMMRRLSPRDVEADKNFNHEREAGTREWIFKDKAFQSWKSSDNNANVLHVHAGPGCGKSVFARFLIDSKEVARSPTSPILYFFFKTGEKGRTRQDDALRAMLYQLYSHEGYKALAVDALPMLHRTYQAFPTTTEQLWQAFTAAIQDPRCGEIVCVLDALDECDVRDRDQIVNKLADLSTYSDTDSSQDSILRVLITSRPYPDIIHSIRMQKHAYSLIDIDGPEHIAETQHEIGLVMRSFLKDMLHGHDDLQEILVHRLEAVPNRTYLWVHLVLDIIKKYLPGNKSKAKILKLVSDVPNNVVDAYSVLLQRSENLDAAKIILQLVLCAERAMSLEELSYAYTLSEESLTPLDDLDDVAEGETAFATSLTGICGMLLIVRDGAVFFLHATVRAFLATNFVVRTEDNTITGPLRLPEAHLLMARACMRMITTRVFEGAMPSIRGPRAYDKQRHRTVDTGLVIYAARNWPYHFIEAGSLISAQDTRSGVQLCDTNHPVFRRWYWVWQQADRQRTRTRHVGRVPWDSKSLMFPCSYGLDSIVEQILKQTPPDQKTPAFLEEPLAIAASTGHTTIMNMLMNEWQGPGGPESCLDKAAQRREIDSLTVCLDRGVDPFRDIDEGGHSALSLAVGEDNAAAVQLMLDRDRSGRDRTAELRAALTTAIADDCHEVAALLRNRGVEVDELGIRSRVVGAPYNVHPPAGRAPEQDAAFKSGLIGMSPERADEDDDPAAIRPDNGGSSSDAEYLSAEE